MRYPPWRSANRKNNCEQASGNADGFQGDSGIEIDIWEQLSFYEIFVFKSNFLEFSGNTKQRVIFTSKLIQEPRYIYRELLLLADHDFCIRDAQSPLIGKGSFLSFARRMNSSIFDSSPIS